MTSFEKATEKQREARQHRTHADCEQPAKVGGVGAMDFRQHGVQACSALAGRLAGRPVGSRVNLRSIVVEEVLREFQANYKGPSLPNPEWKAALSSVETGSWEVVQRWSRSGFLLPSPGEAGSVFDFTITEAGLKFFAGRHDHELSGTWIGSLDLSFCGDAEPDVRATFRNAQKCYESGIPEAAAILAGVAAELIVGIVFDAVVGKKPEPEFENGKSPHLKKTSGQRSYTARWFKVKGCRAKDVRDHEVDSWECLARCLAERRNTTAHGKQNEDFDQQARGSLCMFREFVELSQKLHQAASGVK